MPDHPTPPGASGQVHPPPPRARNRPESAGSSRPGAAALLACVFLGAPLSLAAQSSGAGVLPGAPPGSPAGAWWPGPAAPAGAGGVQETPVESKSAWDHISGLPRDFVSDAWAVTTAPFKLDGADAWAFAGVLGTTAVLFAFDEDIQDAVRRHRRSGLSRALEETGEALEPISLMGNTNAYYAGGIVAGSLLGWDRLRVVAEQLLFSQWIAGLTRKGLGRPVGRRRPDERPDDAYVFDPMDGTSFPSGHASTATQVAAILSHHIDRWPVTVLLHGLAATVVYQRTAAEKHWASDSFLGAAWGWGVAQVVIRRREEDRSDFVPIFDFRSGMVGVSIPVR